ncbi:MAG: leucine/isoleucine/valine transporter permease subunit [Chloroflexota bacterium]|nr:MAG: leucine/isoleucine/valine transporter permease subunit [Chloroflexota bacterium]
MNASLTAQANSPNQTSMRAWSVALRYGLIGGAVALFLALVGMVEAFATRYVIANVIDLGTLLLFLSYLGAGYVAIKRSGARTPFEILSQGAFAGFIASVFIALLAVVIYAIPGIRTIFINASPALLAILTFKMGVPAGLVPILLSGVIFGAIGGLIEILPPSLRRSLIYAAMVVLVFGLMQDLLRVTLQKWKFLDPATSFTFSNNGLTIVGAVTLFILTFLASQLWQRRGNEARARYRQLPTRQQQLLGWGLIAFSVALLLVLPLLVGLFFSEVLVNVGLFILLGLGLNIVVGFAGLLDLGYVAFYAIGAYTVALLTSTSLEIVYAGGNPFWLALPFAVFFAVLAGVILGIPVLKIRGDYLAIVTLGFGEIIRLIVLSDFLKPILGGSRGIELIPKPFIGSFEFAGPEELYYLILAGCGLAAFVAIRVKDSRLGRAWGALREDEDVAEAMGINLVSTKLMAFAMGAAFGGLSGAIFASKLAIIYPSSFNLLLSINVLAVVIIGGMGSIPGVVLGALVLVGLPELLREFSDYRLMLYGAALVIMMLVRPEGLWPEKSRQRELHESQQEEILSGPLAADEEVAREGAAG